MGINQSNKADRVHLVVFVVSALTEDVNTGAIY